MIQLGENLLLADGVGPLTLPATLPEGAQDARVVVKVRHIKRAGRLGVEVEGHGLRTVRAPWRIDDIEVRAWGSSFTFDLPEQVPGGELLVSLVPGSGVDVAVDAVLAYDVDELI